MYTLDKYYFNQPCLLADESQHSHPHNLLLLGSIQRQPFQPTSELPNELFWHFVQVFFRVVEGDG